MMIKEVHLKHLNLTVNQVFIINCVHDKDFTLYDTAAKLDKSIIPSIEDLKKKGILLIKDSTITLSPNWEKEIFKGQKPAEVKLNLLEFVNQYRALFPKGKNTNGFPYKGDKQGCLKKMAKFLKLYPEYTKEVILKVTTSYINTKRVGGFQFMHLAHFFIEKNGVSTLGSLCEQFEEGESDVVTNIIEF